MFARRFTRRIRWTAAAAALGITALFAARVYAMTVAPAELDYARTQVSAGGSYRATWTPETEPVRKGRMHAWTLHVATPDGQPVDSAAISVHGGMPQHGHGLPTQPRVTRQLGAGDYLVEGMKFNMGGWWTVTFGIATPAGAADSVTFNLKL